MSAPTTVEIPTETIIDVVAEIYALEEILCDFDSRQQTPTSTGVGRLASQLLAAIATDGDLEWPDYRHPVAVEACARSEELIAKWYDQFDASERRAAATRIRSLGNGLARYWNEAEIARHQLASNGDGEEAGDAS